MTNTFTNAFDTKIAASTNASASNVKKMQAMRNMLKSEKLAALLQSSNVDAERFTRAIYASEKVIKFAHHAVENTLFKVNDNAVAAFKTAMLCAKNETDLHMHDLECALSRDLKIDETRLAFVYRRNVILDASTIAAQSQQVRDMLKTLNIISADSSRATTFKVNQNTIAQALCATFQIDMTQAQAS